MQCLQASSGELSVLEKQIARLNWQQQQNLAYSNLLASGAADSYAIDALGLQQPRPIQMASHGEGIHNVNDNVHRGCSSDTHSKAWPDLPEAHYHVACSFNAVGQEEACINTSNNGSKKRKAESSSKQKQENSSMVTEDSPNKRIKEEVRGANSEAKRCSSMKEASGDTSKENMQQPKTDYIHVRARRGQATDSHSLAERVRRERISERMKYLQELVPGCNKITGKAGMLDEIINYVQSLQRQVEFLSMKLAAVNPGMDLNLDTFFNREQIQPFCNSGSNVATTSDHLELPYIQFNNLAQNNAYSALEMVTSTPEPALRRTTSTPLGMPDPYLDSCLSVYGSSFAPESILNNIYSADFNQGKASSFPFHLLQGSLSPNNLKM